MKTYPEFYFFPSGDGRNIKYVGDAKKEDLKTFIDEQAASGSKVSGICCSLWTIKVLWCV